MARLYNGKTWEEMDAIYSKQYKDTTAEEREYLAGLTKDDYDAYVAEKNWGSAQPTTHYLQGGEMQPYYGWNGGSVTGADMMAAVDDSQKYGYDIQLDPRNNAGARDAINELLLDAGEQANLDAINGKGSYEDNYQSYMDQIGWTDYQNIFQSLQNTGKLGLTDLEGNPIEQSYELGNPDFVFTPTGAAGDRVNLHPTIREQTGTQSNQQTNQTTQQNTQQNTQQGTQTAPQYTYPEFVAPEYTLPTGKAPDISNLQNLVNQGSAAQQYSGDLSTLQALANAQVQTQPYQSQYLSQLQQMPTMPEAYQSQYADQLAAMMPTMPEAYQSQYQQQLQQMPTMPEAYQSQYAEQLAAMTPTLRLPTESEYAQQLQNATTVPQANGADLSGLEALKNISRGEEIPVYESNLNELAQTQEQRDAYRAELEALLGNSYTPTEFKYDEATDPAWQNYYQQYTRAANQGMSDTLGAISARTGGMASSYAGSAAQQTYDNTMQEAMNILPTLREAAYNKWLNEQNMAISANEREYQRALDVLDRQTQADQTAWDQQTYIDQQNYQRNQDALNRQWDEYLANWEQQSYLEAEANARKQTEWEQKLQANKAEYDRLYNLYAMDYAKQMDAINLQNAYDKEIYNRLLNQEDMAYTKWLNDANMQWEAQKEAYNRLANLENAAYTQYLNNASMQMDVNKEAYNRLLNQEKLAYDQYVNDANMQMDVNNEAYDRIAALENYNYGLYQDELSRQLDAQATEWERQKYLEQTGYNRYMDEVAMQQDAEKLAWDQQTYLDELNYKRAQDELDRQIAAEKTQWERDAYEAEWAYKQAQDAIANQRYEDETAYNREQDALDRQYNYDLMALERDLAALRQQQTGDGGSTGNPAPTTAVDPATFNDTVLRVNDYLTGGSPSGAQTAMNYVERIWDDLNQSERDAIIDMFAQAGYRLVG